MLRKIMVLTVVILLLGTGIVSGFNVNPDDEPKPLNLGNILYVGGTGEGNYTKIQDAIDNTSDGDTVFVYDDSSPYYENLVVNKSINLFGENQNTTILKANEGGTGINITTDNVSISNFYVKDYEYPIIGESCAYLSISNNTFSKNYTKAMKRMKFLSVTYCTFTQNTIIDYESNLFELSSFCTISNNNFICNCRHGGIDLLYGSCNNIVTHNLFGGLNRSGSIDLAYQSNYNTISNNVFTIPKREGTSSIMVCQYSEYNSIYMNVIEYIGPYLGYNGHIGMEIHSDAINNNFSMNTIINCSIAFYVSDSYNNSFYMNDIINCVSGIEFWGMENTTTQRTDLPFFNYVLNNNFQRVLFKGLSRWFYESVSTYWHGNYWGRPRAIPKSILGYKMIQTIIPVPAQIEFDLRPALKPYDIPKVAI